MLTAATLLGWLPRVAGVAAGALSWWRVALVAAGVLAVSNALTGAVSYSAGWRNAENSRAAADLERSRADAAWLLKAAVATGALSADDAAIELSNEQMQGAIDDAIEKSMATLGKLGGCLDPGFMRELAKLR